MHIPTAPVQLSSTEPSKNGQEAAGAEEGFSGHRAAPLPAGLQDHPALATDARRTLLAEMILN